MFAIKLCINNIKHIIYCSLACYHYLDIAFFIRISRCFFAKGRKGSQISEGSLHQRRLYPRSADIQWDGNDVNIHQRERKKRGVDKLRIGMRIRCRIEMGWEWSKSEKGDLNGNRNEGCEW